MYIVVFRCIHNLDIVHAVRDMVCSHDVIGIQVSATPGYMDISIVIVLDVLHSTMRRAHLIPLILVLGLSADASQVPFPGISEVGLHAKLSKSACPQPKYTPPSDSAGYYDTDQFRDITLERLSGAIGYATVAYDDFGDPEGGEHDERWDTFPPLHDYLERMYPLV